MRALVILMLFAVILASSGLAQSQDDPLPMLDPGLHVGIVNADPAPEAKAKIDAAYGEVLAAGMDAIVISFFWSDLEPSPGVYDTSVLEGYLAITDIFDTNVYFTVRTIDTVKVNGPSDLVTASGELADGRHFDDPVILERFNALLDVLVPLLAAHNGFFIAVGNEIDGWLPSHPDEIGPFVTFVSAARERVKSIAPEMGVGAAIMYSGVRTELPLVEQILAVSDAAAFTYYPLNGDFTVMEPDVVFDDFAHMVEAAGDLPVLLQEVGYPSGYVTGPSNDSSGEKQKTFVENVFKALDQHPEIRFMSYFMMSDWPGETCDELTGYYGLSVPRFHEYLCSLGIRDYNGDAKPAYAAFLGGLQRAMDR
jgi:hypothetical protein